MAQNASWRFLDTPAEFHMVKTEANAKKQNANVLGLFTSAEVAAARGALPQYLVRHMFDVQGFLDFLRNLPRETATWARSNCDAATPS